MIPNDQPARSQMIEMMLSVLTNPNTELNKWDSDFIASIDEQYEKKKISQTNNVRFLREFMIRFDYGS